MDNKINEREIKDIPVKSRTYIGAYVSIIFVVFIWGIFPNVGVYMYQFSSPTACSLFITGFAAIILFAMNFKYLKLLNKNYYKLGVITGFFNALAGLLQKIGLLYTTPSKYAFLENLSCVIVPILVYFFIKKKPNFLTILSIILCVLGSAILCGTDIFKGSMNIGDILCATAGILFGVNIAMTGVYAKDLLAPLYVMIQAIVNFIFLLISSIILNFIKFNGKPIVEFHFEFSFFMIAMVIFLAFVSNVLGWILRTNASKVISPSTISVIMPFTAVITSVISIIIGYDEFTLNLLFGGVICLISSILSGYSDIKPNNSKKLKSIEKDSSKI